MNFELASHSRVRNDYYVHAVLIDSILDVKKRLVKEGSVLVDVGCGAMPYRRALSPELSKYIGVDFSDSTNADIFFRPDGTVPLDDNSADIVLSTQVLEHVNDPAMYLKECFRILKPGGLIILSTHGYWIYHPSPEDYWRWTSAGLKKVLKNAGFEIVEFKGLIGLLPVALQLLLDATEGKIPVYPLQKMYTFTIQLLMQILDRFHSEEAKVKNSSVYFTVSKKI